ncbi:unnamed protein product [Durusdinium trenchii]|uniref:Uncharacterized protein n=1 Tax=Durusdinium trenchii TaxID=1381693 RepID=A0ABP0K885_9DINO
MFFVPQMEASGLGFGTARTRLDSRGFRQRDSGSLCVAGKRSDLRAVVPWEWCQAHVQSGEIVWDPNVGTRANSTLISDGIILVATVTTANEEVVLRGEVDLDAEPACITWSCWNDLPSEIQSFMWIKG